MYLKRIAKDNNWNIIDRTLQQWNSTEWVTYWNKTNVH